MPIEIYARNYRGFRTVDLPISKINFLVGDNSSGKTSIIHLISYVMRSELSDIPMLDSKYNIGKFDFFSPFFSYSPVEIGFFDIYQDDDSGFSGKSTAKIITMKRRTDGQPPEVTRCSLFDGSYSATISVVGKKIRYRLEPSPNFSDPDEFKKYCVGYHGVSKGFRISPDLYDGDGVNSLFSVFSALAEVTGRKEIREFLSRVMRAKLPDIRHSGPVRGLPERFYEFERTYKPSGAHFASMWQDLSEDHANKLDVIMSRFGKNSGLFERIEIKRISKDVDSSPLHVRVLKSGKYLELNQVGVGISQVIPILVESMFVAFNSTDFYVLLQQPELHLHPKAQAALGDFIFEMGEQGVRFTIETHSDFLIDRYRARVRERMNVVDPEANIAFFTHSEEGNEGSLIKIETDGTLSNVPDDYKEFFLNEALRTMF